MIDPICTLRIFSIGRYMVVWEAMPERIPLEDYLEGTDMHVGEVKHDVETGKVLWFAVRCRVVHKVSGATLGKRWLGCCLYETFDGFMVPEGYSRDMAQEAIHEARKTIANLTFDPSWGLRSVAENAERIAEIFEDIRSDLKPEPVTEGVWWTEERDDGSTWVMGPDPDTGDPALVASFEMKQDAEYVASLHNSNLQSE